MEGAELELERRSKFLSGLIEKKKAKEHQEQPSKLSVRVRAADMPIVLQDRAFRCARDQLDSMPGKLDSKRLALALKKILFWLIATLNGFSELLSAFAYVQREEHYMTYYPYDPRKLDKMTTWSAWCLDILLILEIPQTPQPVVEEFDAAYGPAWHCIVGTSFGSYVTHSTGGFLYFSIDKVYILLFRTAVEPLER
ncbi:hypothetical protein POTOM_030023 [Populus tomentosa]|uniref:Dynein light chain n=2 Tax=Saliceae TaxID=238069 RepID=A0A8X7ZC18_POPTO|nr:hypothetical protein POTOM_030023 [Populus tomentosa]